LTTPGRAGNFATFSLGFVVFQVFTVDFVAAELHGASSWNTHVPSSLAEALIRIWPLPGTVLEVSWPPRAFRMEDWERLVRWDGALRQAGGQSRAGRAGGGS
jgi:hypothetical protein